MDWVPPADSQNTPCRSMKAQNAEGVGVRSGCFIDSDVASGLWVAISWYTLVQIVISGSQHLYLPHGCTSSNSVIYLYKDIMCKWRKSSKRNSPRNHHSQLQLFAVGSVGTPLSYQHVTCAVFRTGTEKKLSAMGGGGGGGLLQVVWECKIVSK